MDRLMVLVLTALLCLADTTPLQVWAVSVTLFLVWVALSAA